MNTTHLGACSACGSVYMHVDALPEQGLWDVSCIVEQDRLGPLHRFFCGPNAKKSAALAKQQKKRARDTGKRAATEVDSDGNPGGSDAEEDQGPKKKKPKGFAHVQVARAQKGKGTVIAGKGQMAGKSKAALRSKAAKVRSMQLLHVSYLSCPQHVLCPTCMALFIMTPE